VLLKTEENGMKSSSELSAEKAARKAAKEICDAGYCGPYSFVEKIILAAIQESRESQWVWVEEKLPEDGGIYLVWSKLGSVSYPAQFAAISRTWWPIDCEGCFECYPNGPEEIGTGENVGNPVTHWMPLPAPPRGDSKEKKYE
jgi:Protein of unknown function (DUF551)